MSALAITVAALLADSGVETAVGDQVYGVAAPQGKPLPYIVVSLVGESETYLITGAGGYPESTVSVHCHAADQDAANELGETVKTALHAIIKGVVAGHADVDFIKGGADVTDYSEDRTLFRRIMDWRVRWR